MTSGWIVALELSLVLVVALAFAVRELRIVGRLRREREARRLENPDDGPGA